MRFAKFLRAPISKNIYEPLYLQITLLTMHEKYTANEAQLEPSETYKIDEFCEKS